MACKHPMEALQNKMRYELLNDSLHFGETWVTIKGSSMATHLKDGCPALVKKAEVLRPGDILVYKDGDELISHRLIRKRRNKNGEVFFQTKPDNGPALDEPVALNAILGKIVALRTNQDIIRLDNLRGCCIAFYFWLLSSAEAFLHKYVKVPELHLHR